MRVSSKVCQGRGSIWNTSKKLHRPGQYELSYTRVDICFDYSISTRAIFNHEVSILMRLANTRWSLFYFPMGSEYLACTAPIPQIPHGHPTIKNNHSTMQREREQETKKKIKPFCRSLSLNQTPPIVNPTSPPHFSGFLRLPTYRTPCLPQPCPQAHGKWWDA